MTAISHSYATSPRLSIGLPVYNGEQWLEQSINSFLEQSYTDFILIIVDNASTDNTQAICESFAQKDKRVRYVRNEQNIGLFKNFNKAFLLSDSLYFKWAAVSDFCLPDFFEQCVSVLDARPDVVIAYPQAYLLTTDIHGEEVAVEYFDDFNIEDERPSCRYIKYLNREKINNIMHGVIRSGAIKLSSLHRPFPGSDISLVAELALVGKFYEVRERLFIRRFDALTSSLLMNKDTATKLDMPTQASFMQKLNLHSHRFLAAWYADIDTKEKCLVTLYLCKRILLLRYDFYRKLKSFLRP